MRRYRTHWLALVGAMLLLALSLSSAFAHHPSHADNHGNAVSTFVHSLLFGADEEPGDDCEAQDQTAGEECEEEQDSDDDAEGDSDVPESSEDADNHGQCVREYARDRTLVGENGTHGWAVSMAARVTCSGDGEDDEATEGSDEGDEASDDDSSAARDGGERGKSAAAHARAPGKNKAAAGRANGHGNGLARGHGAGGRGHGRP